MELIVWIRNLLLLLVSGVVLTSVVGSYIVFQGRSRMARIKSVYNPMIGGAGYRIRGIPSCKMLNAAQRFRSLNS